MKTKANPKKNISFDSDKFERKRAKKLLHKERSTKHKLSIYDDFEEEEEDWDDLTFNYDDDMDDSPED